MRYVEKYFTNLDNVSGFHKFSVYENPIENSFNRTGRSIWIPPMNFVENGTVCFISER